MFTLEKWSHKYMGDLAEYANNEKIASKLRDAFPYPYTKEDARGYIDLCVAADGKSCMVRAIVASDRAVGSIGVFIGKDVARKTAELGYWLAEEYWGQGIMSKAVKQLCGQAFEAFDIVRIYAEPFSNNARSARVLEKAGFVLEGRLKNSIYKNGEIADSFMYALYR